MIESILATNLGATAEADAFSLERKKTMNEPLNILMPAAENDAIGIKKGGEGDVVRDIAPNLAALSNPNCRVMVVSPTHGLLDKMSGVTFIAGYQFPFAGRRESTSLYEVTAKDPHPKVRHFVLDSPLFVTRDPASGAYTIYSDDPSAGPFEKDGTKYACFCAAVAEGHKLGLFGAVNRVHLHDWHTAFLLVLRKFDPAYEALNHVRMVYSIHNLALQGIRPLRGHTSSLMAWYPQLRLDAVQLAHLCDPDYRDCINPTAVGIRLSDAIHVVSPNYKLEILHPSYPKRGDPCADRIRGEGLELDLQAADREDRLHGILNGCEYDDEPFPSRSAANWDQLLGLAEKAVSGWNSGHSRPVHLLALERVHRLRSLSSRPATVFTSVTRAEDQKVRLMLLPDGNPALSQILRELPSDAVFILLGSGKYEVQLEAMSRNHENFLFLAGFSNDVAATLYANGDLFLMPSSFEPCGISQMLAMRSGQPCVVHEVGGLKDTVQDGVTGFSFTGETAGDQATAFVRTVRRGVELMRTEPTSYEAMRNAAAAMRFRWMDSARRYVEKLYR
jgi:starch synthase